MNARRRSGRALGAAACALVLPTALAGLAHAEPRGGKRVAETASYLLELEKRGLIDRTAVTPKKLAEEVRRADEELMAGQTAAAAARLYAVVEGPRYQDFADSDDFQDAEYRLGLALARGGGSLTARRYLARALGRGPKALYYHAALRAYVDVCLDQHVAAECGREAAELGASDVNQELSYLRGRAAYDAGRFPAAEEELKQVTPRSRFYSSALYLRGVMRVKQADLRGAQDYFCTIADVKEGDSIRFYIDGRYYALRDLARLALARVAHEEGRYEDAFYHYFLIPSDSKKLPDALFEAAWSSLARKEYDLGARLVDEFMKAYGDTPRAAEARLLRATLQVKTCRFAEAEKGFDAVLAEYQPLVAAVDRALDDGAARRALAERLLAPQAHLAANDVDGVIASMLQVDARFYRLQALAHGLEREAADAAHVEDEWRQLEANLAKTKVQAVSGPGHVDAVALLERVNQLGAEVARARRTVRGSDAAKQSLAALEARRQTLAAALQHAIASTGYGTGGAGGLVGMVRADRVAAGGLRGRAADLAARFDDAAGELVRQALVDLRGRLDTGLRQARLGKIDAVVGQKRKLERQIEDLAAGRFPPELFGKLHIEGLIGDDEEYWPPEGERWADEYEGYK